MDIKLVANGYDLSQKLSTYEAHMEVTYKKVLTMLDGSERPFPAASRPVVTFSLLPLTDQESEEIYNALKSMVFSATFEVNGTQRTADVRVVSNLGSTFLLTSVDGKRRYRGGEIVLRGLKSANG
jgi:hypothetical protein